METIAQEAKRPEWQPIETAPKDGTIFLEVIAGIHPETKEPFEPSRAYWSKELRNWQEPGEVEYDIDWKLTHWIPIPNLPMT